MKTDILNKVRQLIEDEMNERELQHDAQRMCIYTELESYKAFEKCREAIVNAIDSCYSQE